VDRLLEPRGRLARRRGQGDERHVVPRLLGEQGDDPRHGRRLARARAAGDDCEPLAHGGRRRGALQVVRRAIEEAREALLERGLVDRLVAAERAQVRGDLALLPPIAVEVEGGADQSQRTTLDRGLPHGDEWARLQPGDPRLDLRPRESREIHRLVGLDRRGLADRREVDEHVAEARRADRERRRERDRLVVLAGNHGEADRDVDVGRREHADVIERAQEPGRVAGAADVVGVVFGERAHAVPRSRTSLSATTSGAGGRQAKTPHGVPPTVGVSGPVIPRTNRYSTPARWRSGS
jgi:hypothetical protein